LFTRFLGILYCEKVTKLTGDGKRSKRGGEAEGCVAGVGEIGNRREGNYTLPNTEHVRDSADGFRIKLLV